MSPRHHGITTLDEYAYWVDQTVHERGGVLEADYVQLDEVVDDEGHVVGHLYPRQWFQLPHGFSVGFDKFVDTDLTVVTYHYQYRRTGGPMILELHNHPGHERDVGSRAHMHVHKGDDRQTVRAPEYDFDEALDAFAVWPVEAN